MFIRRLVTSLCVLTFLLTSGCNDSDYRKAVRTVSGISSGLKNVEKAIENASIASEVESAPAKAMLLTVIQSADLNDEADKLLKGLKSLDPQSKQQLLGYILQISASLDSLQQEGIFHIKSDSSRAKFDAALAAVRGSITIAQSLLEGK